MNKKRLVTNEMEVHGRDEEKGSVNIPKGTEDGN
jgi:hypothetical protein